MRFKYKFLDLDCKYCIKKENIGCVSGCPYILENLFILLHDTAFIEAIKNPQYCFSSQKYTLRYLNKKYKEGVFCDKEFC